MYENTSLGPTTRIYVYSESRTKESRGKAYLGSETLEQRGRALVLDQVLNHSNAADLRLEVGILDTGLDRVERSGDGDRRDGTSNRSDEVLHPGRLVVVVEVEEVVLGQGRSTEELEAGQSQCQLVSGEATYSEASWRVAGHGPSPATVQRRALLEENSHDTTSTEGFRIHLPLDLEGIQWQKDLYGPHA